jgi:transketolase
MYSNEILKRAADNIRILSAAMVEEAKSGHPGGSMGGADFVSVLYSEFLNFSPEDRAWAIRDRFFLDPGHMSTMLYSILAMTGTYSMDELKQFRQWGSPTPGHPELDVKRGIENTSGPLGQGHAMAVGAAIAEKYFTHRFGDWMQHKIYTYISDGGIQEEISQGAGRLAGHYGLSNLIMFYDANDIQLATTVNTVTSEDTEAKYKAWNWNVITINGNDIDEIRLALMRANEEQLRPTLIIGKTIMGKGAVKADNSSFEHQVSTHGQPLSKAGASIAETIKNLGGNPENPFVIFDEVKDLFTQVLENKKAFVEQKNEEYKAWKQANPQRANRWEAIVKGKLLPLDFHKIELGENMATRNASATVLGKFAETYDNMIVMSADLANSDKTDGFLKKSKAITPSDFSGSFLHVGVSELTMASLANGMALHYIHPVCGTFFVFSDYMKPAVRIAALMELPVKYVWTHDSFRVGEDGPTHQPIEQEAQIRLMEQMQNHSGNPAMLVLRPADGAETVVAWDMAVNNQNSPTAMILSRQNIKDLPAEQPRIEEAFKAKVGAYVVVAEKEADVILIANGSEVSTLVDAAKILKEKNIKAQVISVISEVLFRRQDPDYLEMILPEGVKRFGLTSGLPITLQNLVGDNGKVFGKLMFGASAPATILDEKFGFTPELVAAEIEQFLLG